MIRVSQDCPKVMEFTSFRKRENVSDDELINSVLKLESLFLLKQEGVIFHCLVRNFRNEYANILFVKDFDSLKRLEEAAYEDLHAGAFFNLIEEGSEEMNFHEILKENFKVPDHFSGVECGSFSLQDKGNPEKLVQVSEIIEEKYLNCLENTRGHFIGKINENLFSELTFGRSIGETKKICMGYVGNQYCQLLLDMADEKSMKLDFWYLIA